MIDQESITRINIQLQTIATINSFTNHDKTYYIPLLDKIDDDITSTLHQHFEVKTWNFDVEEIAGDWNPILKDEFLMYFSDYITTHMYTQYQSERNTHICRERWYECFEQDYLVDIGEKIVFLHFG